MCGLVGIADATLLYAREKKALSELIYVDTLRGPHSTGLFMAKQGEVNTLKMAVPGEVFVDTKKYDKFTLPNTYHIAAAHNRWATVGKVNADNAHPFTHGSVTLMHNGTLKRQGLLEKANEFATDSECIAYNMSIEAPEDAHKVIAKLQGAFALVWYDTRDDTLNFIRNSERELYMAFKRNAKDPKGVSDVLMWASEAWMLDMVCERHNINLSEPGLFEELWHHKVKIKNGKLHLVGKIKCEEGPKVVVTNAGTTYYSKGTYIVPKTQGAVTPSKLPVATAQTPRITDIFYAKAVEWLKNFSNGYGTIRFERVVSINRTVKAEVSYKKQEEYVELSELDKVPLQVTGAKWDPSVGQHVITCRLLDVNKNYKDWFVEDTPKEEESDPYDDHDSIVAYIPGPHGKDITEAEFAEATEDGCSWCTEEITLDDADDCSWFGESVLCPACKDCLEQYPATSPNKV